MTRTNRYTLYFFVISAAALGMIAAHPVTKLIVSEIVLSGGPQSWRSWAIDQLRDAGPDGLAPLFATAADASEDRRLRRRAFAALSFLGYEAGPAAPGLAELLSDPDREVRGLASEALGRIGSRGGAALPTLIKAFAHPDREVRFLACRAAAAQGPSAFSSLRGALRDSRPKARVRAALALGLIRRAEGDFDPEGSLKLEPKEVATFVAALGSAIGGAAYEERVEIARALGGLKGEGGPAVPILIRELSRGGREPVWEALATIGPPAVDAAPTLIAAYDQCGPYEHVYVLKALLAIGVPGAQLTPILKAAAKDPYDSETRLIARDTLAKLAASPGK